MEFKDVELARQACGDKLEKIRKARVKAMSITCGIVFGIEAIIVILNIEPIIKNLIPGNFSSPSNFLFLLLPIFSFTFIQLVFIFIIVNIIVYKKIHINEEAIRYKKAYKAYFIERQLASVFQDLQYDHKQGLDKRILNSTGMIHTGDIYKSNDLTRGKYKDVRFAQADVHILEEHEEKDKDGNVKTYTVTVFKGRYMIFEFHKKFQFKLMLSNSGTIGPRQAGSFKKIETESVDFNKHFIVYAEDGFEAFYILDPAFMERVEKLGQNHPGQIGLFFVDNCLFIGINDNNDSFEPPDPRIPLDEKTEQAKVINEIKLITDIVDNLKLDRNK